MDISEMIIKALAAFLSLAALCIVVWHFHSIYFREKLPEDKSQMLGYIVLFGFAIFVYRGADAFLWFMPSDGLPGNLRHIIKVGLAALAMPMLHGIQRRLIARDAQ